MWSAGQEAPQRVERIQDLLKNDRYAADVDSASQPTPPKTLTLSAMYMSSSWNPAGAVRAVRWRDHVGRNQVVSSWVRNSPGRFYCCRVLAVEHDQHEGQITVHFDVRGEIDLLPPCGAKLWLGRAGERDDSRSCLEQAQPKVC